MHKRGFVLLLGVVSYAAYLPSRRIEKKAIASANQWFSPGLRGLARGHRTMAGWDEDSITMSVEAARMCLGGHDRSAVDSLIFASTTAPFADRLNASVVASALTLDEGLNAEDAGGSQRAGTSALISGLRALKSGEVNRALVVAGELRSAKVASVQELQFGDGAAAIMVGSGEDVVAELVASHSMTSDFVDHFRSAGERFDYSWEDRWIRDEGLAKIVPKAIEGALGKADMSGEDIDAFIMPHAMRGASVKIAKICGIPLGSVCDTLGEQCGNLGVAHPLLMLALALDEAKPGQNILVTGFGQGCDAIILRTTDRICKFAGRMQAVNMLSSGVNEDNYLKFLAFKGMLELEKGMRAEHDSKAALSTLYRRRDMITGLIGGQCSACGTAQFPRSRTCASPNCGAVDTQKPYSFAEKQAKVLSWSADYLAYTPDPPQHYGVIDFDGGGRFMADFTDIEQGSIDSGSRVRMVFRIKGFDEKRGFRKYFWKATLVAEE